MWTLVFVLAILGLFLVFAKDLMIKIMGRDMSDKSSKERLLRELSRYKKDQ